MNFGLNSKTAFHTPAARVMVNRHGVYLRIAPSLTWRNDECVHDWLSTPSTRRYCGAFVSKRYLSAETTIIGLDFAADNMSIFVKIFMKGSGIIVYFCKSDVSALQDQTRSLILVPIESAYVTSY